LFIQKYGKISKWTSPYAEYLYNLDPVFVGSSSDLKIMLGNLKERKDADELHEDDIFVDGWHSNCLPSESRDIAFSWKIRSCE
jgi:hypothetical protein